MCLATAPCRGCVPLFRAPAVSVPPDITSIGTRVRGAARAGYPPSASRASYPPSASRMAVAERSSRAAIASGSVGLATYTAAIAAGR